MVDSGQLDWEGVTGGVVHALPEDLGTALRADAHALELWESLTPLGRNEFICWVTDAKKAETRARRIRRTREELEEGKRPLTASS
ncbi:YdeI/OmpD-associated family protein [uncultured Corynebacterium sp.]|uniref:YdeI/OmpD-associated family protein n=1 Tax=uncultured Corynebacterium sp. TaxID=159447 RepID=UPI0025DE1137|nr:YdeI/OmpD-associated family protein [uncultured Corynebacterium sp.]